MSCNYTDREMIGGGEEVEVEEEDKEEKQGRACICPCIVALDERMFLFLNVMVVKR